MTKSSMELEKSTREDMKEVAKKSQTYDQLIRQRITCDAVGCEELGSIELNVNAGKYGTVKLFVCANCVGKFTD
jgi:hypothetical protein